MINVILDTNIIVSAALTPNGNPAKVMKHIYERESMQLYYSVEIFAEYKEVLFRPYLNISIETQTMIINAIAKNGILIIPNVSIVPLPDESDRIFYDTAKSSGSILVTGNIKHFPDESFIMTPLDFVEHFINGD
jgi:putative PIN family toxin of toxin-antitoxin system